MTQRRIKDIRVAVSTTTTSQWVLTDYRFDENPERLFFGTNASGGTTIIQGAASVADTVPDVICPLFSTTSASFNGTIHGAWPMVRVIQSGGDATSITIFVI